MAGLAVCGAPCALADAPATRIWINAGVLSVHFDRDKDLREDNIGLGVEVVRGEHALLAGTFINSNRARSRYAGYAWRPLQWKVEGLNVLPGVAVGVFDGYPRYRGGDAFPAALPVVAIEGRRLGLNIYVVPTIRNRLDGAVAFQLKAAHW